MTDPLGRGSAYMQLGDIRLGLNSMGPTKAYQRLGLSSVGQAINKLAAILPGDETLISIKDRPTTKNIVELNFRDAKPNGNNKHLENNGGRENEGIVNQLLQEATATKLTRDGGVTENCKIVTEVRLRCD